MPSPLGIVASGASTSGAFDPLSAIPWSSVVWAEDPGFAAPADGAAVEWWRNAGTVRTSGTSQVHLDATHGLYVPFKQTYAAFLNHKASYDITGDLEFECLLRLEDYTPATVPRGIVEKRVSNGEVVTLSWEFAIRVDGTLQTVWYDSGGSLHNVVSTVAVTATDGQDVALRTTVALDNGGQFQVKWYQGTDIGSTNTLLDTVNGASGIVDIRTNTSPFSLGVAGVSNDANGIGGYLKRAVLRSGIGGTAVFDVDFRRADTGVFAEAAAGDPVYVRANIDMNQATANRRPLYRATGTAALANRPTVQGDGSNDYLGTTEAFTDVAQPYSVVAIVAGASSGASPGHLRDSNSGWVFYWNAANSRWWCTAGTITEAPTNSADNGAHLLRYLANGASSVIAEDGSTLATAAGGANAANRMGVFDIGTTNFPFAGHVAFFGLYSGDVTAHGGWAGFKAWVTSHYGIVVA